MKTRFNIPLEDDTVLLRPTLESDYEGLFALAADPEVWSQHNAHDRWKPEVFREFFEQGLKNELGCYTIMDKATGAVAGTTRFYRYNPETRSVYVGYTFLGRSFWGTGFNQKVKNLILDHAFTLVSTVYFDIFEKNHRSQKAVAKLGATLQKCFEDKQQWKLSKDTWTSSSKQG